MKKIIILSACTLLGLSAFAQANVLKDAERAMKGKSPMTKVVEIITPAFTNPETQNNPQTWYIPGKAAYNEFDNLFSLKAFGKLPQNGEATMGKNLIEGYKYFMKALPLDSIPNEKGKIKPKYSKDIIGTIVGHYSDYNNSGVALWNLTDYKGAYDAWNIFVEISENPEKFKGANVPHDSILSEIIYNQALAAWQAKELQKSLDCFLKAKAKGYTKKNVYDYAISVANEMKDTATVIELSKEALPLYGNESTIYIQFIINDFLQKHDYDNARNAINEAIQNDPDNAEYYSVLGVIYDNEGKRPEAQEQYKKSLSLNPESEYANYYLGKSYCEDAYAASDKAPSNPEEIDAYFNNVIKPYFLSAIQYLEKANQINPDNYEVVNYLKNAYYNLKDEAKLNELEKMYP